MRLCMFHPVDRPLARGWVGRVEGDRVLHLAAQTLQHFFTGGSSSREHAEYPLDEVVLLAPVPHPPSVRVFERDGSFAFANPAAIVGPGATVAAPPAARGLLVLPRLVAVIGAEQAIGGITVLAEWRTLGTAVPKDRDFCLALGPIVVTRDEEPHRVVVRADGVERARERHDVDWEALRAYAAGGTELRTGDLLAAPAAEIVDLPSGTEIELDAGAAGVLGLRVA